jgi:hypothetical protein
MQRSRHGISTARAHTRGWSLRTSGAAGHSLASHRRRTTERTVLHELVLLHTQAMLADMRDADLEVARCRA